MAEKFGRDRRSEYFDVPRGRVVIRRETGEGIVYHGASTAPERLRRIAAEFRLTRWAAVRDDHYATGAEADALFEEK